MSRLRSGKAALAKQGMEFKVPGRHVPGNTALTKERVERLNSIGFVWSVQPKTSWEDSFRDLLEYHELNGRWPSQTLGKLGGWVHRQRYLYNEKDESFMKNRFPQVRKNTINVVPTVKILLIHLIC